MITLFENFNPMLDEQKKLLSHITKIFNQMGYDYYGYLDRGTFETDYFKTKNNIVFNIKGDHSVSLIFLTITLRIGSVDDEVAKFVPDYFKTIDGLELYREDKDWFNTTFEIVGNVDDIIKQITVEDFEIKFKSKNYNL